MYRKSIRAAFALMLLWPAARLLSQVTTATVYATVTDPSGAGVSGATVTLIHEATNAQQTQVADAAGDVTFNFLQIGAYTIRVEAQGFKKYEAKGLQLMAAQTLRRTLPLELGSISETVNVETSAPLVSTASSEQAQTFEQTKVTELPLSRRNVSSLLRVAPGVDIGSGRSPRLNGIGASGTGISVDGTDANSNPEQRSMSQYGARNYIDVMSIDAIQEVQLARGILPAEYGGVVGGQVNLISKSGTNQIHGTVFENYQSHVLNARNPFVAARTATGEEIRKPRIVFNQFGGSLGGPIIKDRVFAFGTYEGYRESASRRVNGTVPTAAYRSQILQAVPFQETKILMGVLPDPNVPINADLGRFEGIRNALSRDNHWLAKVDARVGSYSSMAVTYTRGRPFGLDPSYYVDGANDRTYEYMQDRVSASFTTGRASWMSETRFGWNFNNMSRLDKFLTQKDPNGGAEQLPWDRSVPRISISGSSGFSVGSAEIWDMNGTTYSIEENISRHVGKHSFKFGGRYGLNGGFRTNPENPAFSFQNKADFFANVPSSVVPSFGSPPYSSRMIDFGFFAQDDWRATANLTLNIGLRYDFYGKNVSKPTTEVPVGFYNLRPPTDWPLFNFGPPRDPNDPYNNDALNLGPRFGFAYNIAGKGSTIIRGGFGIMFSPQMPGVVRQAVANPIVPFRVTFTLAEARDLGLQFPKYSADLRQVVERQAATTDQRFPFSAINPGLQNPYAMHYQFNIQHSLSPTLMMETSYVGVRGVKFILHRRPNLPDRLTGIRPNPDLIFGGYYVDNTQNTVYNAWETSLRKRFSHGVSFDAHYTLSKSLGVTGGDIGAYYGSDNDSNDIQEFFNPRADRGPNPGDATHRIAMDWVYDLPQLSGAHRLVRQVFGGWEIGGILTARSGEPFTVTQSCASAWYCRPDFVGGATSFSDWKDHSTSRCTVGGRCTIQYLDRAAFAFVPMDSTTRIAVQPGTLGKGALRGPASWGVDLSLSKNFSLGEKLKLQFRTDMFNATNHVNYNGPNTNLNSSTFGEISGAGAMRVIQLNAKLVW